LRDLVFLPGWGFDERVWQPVAERLAGEFRIGHDIGSAPSGAIVCGWSLGAMRALKLAARKSAVAARLVLVGATPRFVQAADWPAAQPPEMLASFAAAVAADSRAALRRFAALINQGDQHARALTRQMSALVAEGDPASLLKGLDELRATDLRKSAVAVRQPTLLIHGECDPLMPLAAGRWLAGQLPNARLEVFAGAAHAPFLSQPDSFVDLLRQFAHE
jgi:pimeloyl-[acyl-carrier protein] methyl ester esterase